MLESFHFRAVVLKDKPDEIRQDQNMQRPLDFSSLGAGRKQGDKAFSLFLLHVKLGVQEAMYIGSVYCQND